MMTIRRLLLLAALALPAPAEIVDRIVATVGHKVITANMVRQQIRVAAFLDEKPLETSAAAFEAMRDRLIDRLLILEEMRASRYAIPELAEVRDNFDRVVKEMGGPEAFAAALGRYHVTEDNIRTSLRDQQAVLRFTIYRFRPAVQIDPADVQEYYDKRWPEPVKPPFEDVRDRIEVLLRAEQITQLLNRWLRETRQRTHIETFEEARP